MDHDFIKKRISQFIKGLFVVLGIVIAFSIFAIEATKKPQAEIDAILEERRKNFEAMVAGKQLNENLPEVWPAKMNVPYPALGLIDQTGQNFSLADLKGRVIIVEFIDMSSPVSQAQSGAGLMSAYAGGEVDEFAKPFSEYLRDLETPLVLPHDRIMELKILVYGPDGGMASRDDAQNWATHFNLKRDDNIIVAVPQKDMRDKATDGLVGGFQLIDKNLLLRADSAGPTPKHNLTLTLTPLVPKLAL